jgi:TolA-binding protein
MGWTDFSWSMCVSDTRFRRVARVIVIFVFMQLSVSVMAETADERIQRLENEVNELRQMLKEQKQTQDLKSTPSDSK